MQIICYANYLLASSIAIATVILSLGVVTCADETHHLCALVPLLTWRGKRKPYKTSLLNHKIIFAEHIVCVFPENIISRFNVFVNNVVKEFAEMLQIK